MNVNCVYRWQLDSVITFSTYDTDDGTIKGLDADVFCLPADNFKYHEGNYTLYGAVPKQDLHRYLCMHTDAYAVIDYDCIGFIIVYKQRVKRQLFVGELRNWELDKPVFDTHDLINIGKAKTLVEQYTYVISPQNLYYDKTDKVVHLPDGDFPINFPVDELEPVTTFNRYVDMVEDHAAVGVVRSGGYNKLLIKDPTTGVLRKE